MLNYRRFIYQTISRCVIANRLDTNAYLERQCYLKAAVVVRLDNGSTLHAGIFIAVLMILVVHILMTRTTLGFELKL